MKATVVILPSVEEQREAGDDEVIDPSVVKLLDAEPMPLWANFSYRVPEDVLGQVTNIRVEEGRLVADVDFLDRAMKPDRGILNTQIAQYGISGPVVEYHNERVNDRVIRVIDSMELMSVGVSSKPPAKPKP